MKKLLLLSLLGASLVARAASGELRTEAGASYVLPHSFDRESAYSLGASDRSRWAPYVAAGYDWNDLLGLRLAYRYIGDLRATVEYGTPPAPPGQPVVQIVTWGHYHDNVHQVSLAPELTLHPHSRVAFVLSPALNWVSSRGDVSYSTTNPTVLLIAKRDRNDDGFTVGGSVQLRLAVGARGALTAAYEHVDLKPSFGRTADVFSGGFQWTF